MKHADGSGPMKKSINHNEEANHLLYIDGLLLFMSLFGSMYTALY